MQHPDIRASGVRSGPEFQLNGGDMAPPRQDNRPAPFDRGFGHRHRDKAKSVPATQEFPAAAPASVPEAIPEPAPAPAVKILQTPVPTAAPAETAAPVKPTPKSSPAPVKVAAWRRRMFGEGSPTEPAVAEAEARETVTEPTEAAPVISVLETLEPESESAAAPSEISPPEPLQPKTEPEAPPIEIAPEVLSPVAEFSLPEPTHPEPPVAEALVSPFEPPEAEAAPEPEPPASSPEFSFSEAQEPKSVEPSPVAQPENNTAVAQPLSPARRQRKKVTVRLEMPSFHRLLAICDSLNNTRQDIMSKALDRYLEELDVSLPEAVDDSSLDDEKQD